MDHTWVECMMDPTSIVKQDKTWKLNTYILLNQVNVDDIKQEIEDFFLDNDNGEVSYTCLWDALKAVLRGQIISVLRGQITQRRIKKQTLQNIKSLEQQHKLHGGKKTYKNCKQKGNC